MGFLLKMSLYVMSKKERVIFNLYTIVINLKKASIAVCASNISSSIDQQ